MKKARDSRVVRFPRVQRLVEENRGLAHRLEETTDSCRALQDEISILSLAIHEFVAKIHRKRGPYAWLVGNFGVAYRAVFLIKEEPWRRVALQWFPPARATRAGNAANVMM